MVVVEDDPEAWGDAEAVVYSQDRRYLVNLAAGFCECPDNQYREIECKHLKRARFALGIRLLPEWIDPDSVDYVLRRRLEANRWPLKVLADGVLDSRPD